MLLKKRMETAFHMLVNTGSYTLWTIGNKYQFTNPSWKVSTPIMATAFQLFISGFIAYLCGRVLKIARAGPCPATVFWKRIVPLGVARATDIGFGNMSLTLVSVALQQVVKSTIPVYVSILSAVLFGKRYGTDVWVSLVPIVAGTVLASLGEMSSSELGFTFAIISCFGRALKAILNGQLLSKSSEDHAAIDPFTLLMLEAPLSGLFIGAVALVVEGSEIFTLITTPSVIALNILCGILSFATQLSYLQLIVTTSPLTCTVLMNLKMVFLILLSVVVFGTSLTVLNYVGIAIASVGCVLYAQRNQKSKVS